MEKRYKYLVGQDWRESDNAFEVKNPFGGSTVGITYKAAKEDIEEAIISAVEAFKVTRKTSSYERSKVLLNIRNGLIKRKEEIARTITLEAGKPITHSRNEIDRAINVFQIAMEETKRIGGELIPLDLFENTKGKIAINKRFPIGPILGITPFNFPLNLICHKVAPAIASGNTIVIKPSSITPLTSLLFGEIVSESMIVPGSFSVLPCMSTDGEGMVSDERFRMLTFTGSSIVGWHLKSIAGKKKVTLELGGNGGVIIDKDVDIDYAVQRCTVGGFSFSGQSCISLQRIYIHEDIYENFVTRFLSLVKKIKVGNPLEETTEVGPMIDESSAKRTEAWIIEARKGGANILIGGKKEGAFLEPTVISDSHPNMKVNCEEIFAPVVTVHSFSSFNDAVESINNSKYGLQTGIFTKDINNILLAYDNLDVGCIITNDIPTFRTDNMPYGGTKESGLGREGVKYAIEEMTEQKLLVLSFNP